MNSGALASILALVSIVVVGCGPFADQANVQNRADEVAGTIGAGAVVGQRFVAHCDGLSQIDVQIARFPELGPGSGKLFLSIAAASDTPAAPESLFTSQVDEASLTANQWLTLSFPPVTPSAGHRFVLRAWSNAESTSPVTLWATSHQGTGERERMTTHGTTAGSLVYRAFCSPGPVDVALERIRFLVDLGWLWPIALALSVLPGLGLAALIHRRENDPAIILGYAVGWSVLTAPIGLVILGAIGAAGREGLALLVIGGVGLMTRLINSRRMPIIPEMGWETVVALASTVGAYAIRVATTTGLVVPLWVDSVQHSAITQSILDGGRVPDTYAPFVPSEIFDYHFGFHALAASVAGLANGTAADAVLAVGQTLSALTPLVAYAFARDLVGSKRAGAIAALLVGLVMTQPTYLLTWGRYTELAGLVALPVVFVSTRNALAGKSDWRTLVISAGALAGIVVVHPRVAVFAASLLVSHAGVQAIARKKLRGLAELTWRGFIVGAIVVSALSPWLRRLVATQHEHTFLQSPWNPIDFPFGIATAGADHWVGLAALLGLGMLLIRIPLIGVTLVIWSAIVLVAANPSYFRLPVYLWINNESVAIGLFLPISVLAGYTVDTIATLVQFDRWRPVFVRGTVAAIAAVAFSLSPPVVGTINACCGLVDAADVAAWGWVRAETPPDALFLINGYVWNSGIWAGTDAGYWLPVTASRRTTLPPLFYATGPTAKKLAIDRVAADIDRAQGDPALLAEVARTTGATYVFVGSRGGVIDPGRLSKSSDFRLVYREGGAWVFEVTGVGVTVGDGDGVGVAVTGGINSTVTAVTPADVATPSAEKAAGLRSVTSG